MIPNDPMILLSYIKLNTILIPDSLGKYRVFTINLYI